MNNVNINPLKITLYSSSNFPYGGAAESFILQLSRGLLNQKIEVDIVLLYGNNCKEINNTGILSHTLFFKRKIKYEIFKPVELILIILFIPFSLIKRKFFKKINCIILYGVEYFYLVLPFFLFCKLLNIKIYRFITDYYGEKVISPKPWKKPKVFFYHLQFNFLDKYLNGLVFLSSFMQQISFKYGIKENKTIVIPHFIDIKSFKVKKNYNFKVIGYCGTVNESNGLYILVESFIRLKDLYNDLILYIIGPISENDKKKILNLLSDKNDSVFIFGSLPQTEIPIKLIECDILVNPRISSITAEAGFPTKVGEYLATKTPVISTALGDITKYFTNYKELILIEPDSVDALITGILFVLENKEKAIEIANSGHLWALNNLDYIISTKKLLKFITK